MASSSVSQDDPDIGLDFEVSSRRSRIRTARARNINPPFRAGENNDDDLSDKESGNGLHPDQDISPKPISRIKEKRINRPIHSNKGKPQRDRRKLREKRRSAGVVQIYSTESTADSTGEDEELVSLHDETRGFIGNEGLDNKDKISKPSFLTEHTHKRTFRTKRFSPSDLEADDEDNQDYDSLTMSDSTLSLIHPSACVPERVLPPFSSFLPSSRSSIRGPNLPIAASIDTQLERAREENRKLITLMEEKEKQILSLESRLGQLSFELSQANNEKTSLRQENNALIRAMSSMGVK